MIERKRTTDERVAVIGAGAAGLVTARELSRAGLEPVVFERLPGVGGTWRYTERIEPDPLGLDVGDGRVHSSIYAGLRTNLPTELMAFRDFPFDEDTPRFCDHGGVQAYLERFASAFDLRRHIRFEAEVTRVARLTEDEWLLSRRNGDGREEEERFSAVAICNGHYSVPHVPDLPGAFAGARSHSHNYRRPEPFAGMRVVILGARSSGTDLSREIAHVAEHVHLCAREHGATRAVSPRLTLEPTIVRLGPGRSIELADGRRLDDIDHLLYCTGYHYAIPFLEDGIVEVDDDFVGPLFLDLIPPASPRLAIVGLPFAVVPFPLFEAQARWWASALTAAVALPTEAEMRAEARSRLDALVAAGVPRRHWLKYGDRQFDYVDVLLRRTGSDPLPPWFAPLYRATREAKARDPEGYREDLTPKR